MSSPSSRLRLAGDGTASDGARHPVGMLAASQCLLVPALVVAMALLVLSQAPGIQGRDGLYPTALALILLAIVAASVVHDVRAYRLRQRALRAVAATDETEAERGIEGEHGVGVHWARVGWMTVMLLCVAVMMAPIGFMAVSALLCAATLVLMGIRSPVRVTVFTVLFIAGAYGLFVVALKVPFPSGGLLF
jgi:hypothetical protein